LFSKHLQRCTAGNLLNFFVRGAAKFIGNVLNIDDDTCRWHLSSNWQQQYPMNSYLHAVISARIHVEAPHKWLIDNFRNENSATTSKIYRMMLLTAHWHGVAVELRALVIVVFSFCCYLFCCSSLPAAERTWRPAR